MKITMSVSRKKMYGTTKKGVRDEVIKIITYGLNETRNTAVTGIAQGKKTGKVRPDGSRSSAVGEYPATDTGFLQSNIYVQKSPSGLSGSVISQAEYSSALEFGTSKMGARPFMQPSAEEVRPKMRRRARRIFR